MSPNKDETRPQIKLKMLENYFLSQKSDFKNPMI